MTKEFFILLVSDSIVDEHKSVAVLNEKAAHRPCAEIIFVGGISSLPDGLWHNTKHRAAVKFEKTGVNYVEFQNFELRV